MVGRFIVFEGIDGSGKSTAIAAVASAFSEAGQAHWQTREETNSRYGEAVREAIRSYAPPLTTTYLFLADRAQHVPDIRKHLESEHVLCDRYMHSTMAYQGVTLDGHVEAPREFLAGLHKPLGLRPDHVILLDLPAATAVGRVLARGASTPYEKVSFLEKVRQEYLHLAKESPKLFTIIDASQPADVVAKACVAAARRAIA